MIDSPSRFLCQYPVNLFPGPYFLNNLNPVHMVDRYGPHQGIGQNDISKAGQVLNRNRSLLFDISQVFQSTDGSRWVTPGST